MTNPPQTIEIRLIRPGDKLTGLSLGDQKFSPLKTFLQNSAADFQLKSLARTYGAFIDSTIKGYVTLVCGEIVIERDDKTLVSDVDYRYLHYPAVKIARLATHKNFQKKGIGKSLVELSLGIAQDQICPAVGCRFVVVDAKQDAVSFYERRGFSILDTKANRDRPEPVMFLDMQKTSLGEAPTPASPRSLAPASPL